MLGSEAQSESEYPMSSDPPLPLYISRRSCVVLRYCKTQMAAAICSSSGFDPN